MQQPALSPDEIREFVRAKAYRESRSMLFESLGAFQWHWRQNKARYACAGAVILNGNKLFVHPRRFDEEFARIAHEETVGKLAGSATSPA